MKETEVELACLLTEREREYRGQELAAAQDELDALHAQRREAAKAFTQQTEEITGRMRKLARAIRTRTERRLVPCQVLFHTPAQAKKQLIRLDTGELLPPEVMSMDECQENLFEAAQ
jgi:hypothetical protein